jgi:hypothetical protein
MCSCRSGRKGELPKPARRGTRPVWRPRSLRGRQARRCAFAGAPGGAPVPAGPWLPERRQTLGHRPGFAPSRRRGPATTAAVGLPHFRARAKDPTDQALGNKKSTSHRAALFRLMGLWPRPTEGPGPASAKTANLGAAAPAHVASSAGEEQNFTLQRGLAPCYQRRPCAFPLPSFAAP